MSTTVKLKRRSSPGASTEISPRSSSKYTLCRRVMCQAIKDAVYGSESEKRAVVRWLVSEDFQRICHLAEVNPEEWQVKIAELFRGPAGLRVYYARNHSALLLG
jgi:hypothetical protein